MPMETMKCPECSQGIPVLREATQLPVQWRRSDGSIDASGRLHDVTILYPHGVIVAGKEYPCAEGKRVLEKTRVDDSPLPGPEA